MSQEQNQGPADDGAPSGDVELSGRERRLHLQAYEYWYGLLQGRRFPSISDMGREQIDLFRAQSFLVDFPQRYGDPALRFVGDDIMAQYEGDNDLVGVSVKKIPSESILSRLSIHYMEVISNRAPISFEAEFDNSEGTTICYRGILLPFSDDDADIHFIMGILTWEEKALLKKPSGGFGRAGLDTADQGAADQAAAEPGAQDVEEQDAEQEAPAKAPEDAPEDVREETAAEGAATPVSPPVPAATPASTPTSTPAADPVADPPPAPVNMADVLQKGRDNANAVGHVDSRSRDRLYAVLADALALYEAARQDPDAYKQMLAEAGIRQQARAPLTPVIKLIFGPQYDKTRITEYATALIYAIDEGQTSATVKEFIAGHDGGIKGCVRQARRARRAARGGQSVDALDRAVKKLRGATALGSTALDQDLAGEDEFVLLLGRARPGEGIDGLVDIVAVLDEKGASLETFLKRASKQLK
ncbi:MAG: hypothetical protein IID51_09165 [Proteobacteria bacterium]|nr:hypothetical protein [Pseudomonadota bacterium]